MRRATVTCACLALVAATFAGGAQDKNQARRQPAYPNLILVSIESLRADHVGCYGYDRPTTPTIDRLAAEGVRFVNAVSSSSWTLPSHAAIFTGLYDSAHGVVDNGTRLEESYFTLAEALHAAGYHTAGFYAGPYLHPTFGFAQGFETYQSCMTPLLDGASDAAVRRQPYSPTNPAHRDVSGPRTVERFTAWLGTADDRPLFAFLHLWDPHYDYIPPQRYVEMFDPDYAGDVTAQDYMKNRRIRRGMPRRDLKHIQALYDAEIRFADETLGQILAQLEKRGLLNDALVVVTADHGEEFFDHGRKGHQHPPFEEMVRVPLIFHWPQRLPAGMVIKDQVRLIDLMPTLLALTDVQLTTQVQGRDLTPLLEGKGLPAAAALCELNANRTEFGALRTNEWKLIYDRATNMRAYFDLRADPRERRPILGKTPEALAAFAELDRLTKASRELRQRLGGGVASVTLSDELRRRLESLGYVSADDEATTSQPATTQPANPPIQP